MDRMPNDGGTQAGPTHSSSGSDRWNASQRPVDAAQPTVASDTAIVSRDDEARLAQLALTIQTEVIPRLMLAHRAANDCPQLPVLSGEAISKQDVVEFAKVVLAHDETMAVACAQTMCARGISVEKVYLELLAPTARYLGELWTQDLCDFNEVTVGLGRLQRVLRELSPAFGQAPDRLPTGRRVLLLPSPGEQHTFGLVMVGEFFRRAGWEVAGGPWDSEADAAMRTGTEWFDVVGFSLGAEVHLDALAACIRSVRRQSRNPDVAIMVGGPIFSEWPAYVVQVGADGVAIDGRKAPTLAEQLILERGRYA
jgi:methanogenic corrinoid protein MtbC1